MSLPSTLAHCLDSDPASPAAQLRETGVLSSRSYTEWNWLVLEQLLRGPLRHPARLVKVINGSSIPSPACDLTRHQPVTLV